MDTPPLSVRAYSFEALCELIAKATTTAGGTASDEERKDTIGGHPHLDYFREYFFHLGAMTVVVERDYVDRHFIDDHAAYYVSCLLGKYSSVCSRLHFFSCAFERADLDNAVLNRDGSLTVDRLQDCYLGFIVVKPLPTTFIGRTCLRTYVPEGGRHYPTTQPYHVHLLGISLEVQSLPFQQQDTVVAACATSALWSVFHRTGVLFQHAIQSPAQITKTACESLWTRERGFPNRGLYPEQMALAVKRAGLEPEMVGVETAATLKATVYAYLKAGIPVVLNAALYDTSASGDKNPAFVGGHAVAVTGFRMGSRTPAPDPNSGTLLRSSRVEKLYVHDDGIGPFARLPFSDRTLSLTDGRKIDFIMGSSWMGEDRKRGSIVFAPEMLILPLYHKVRIPLDAVLRHVFEIDAEIESLRDRRDLPVLSERVEWDVFLSTESDFKCYLREKRPLSADQTLEVLETCLPRFLWRAVAEIAGQPVFEFTYDATDIEQGDYLLRFLQYNSEVCGNVFG